MFFDRKEEVIDIQLTPYGKKMYGHGVFEPMYYSFSDHDIIYDVQHIGIEENHNDSHVRIYDNIRTKVQNRFTGINTGSVHFEHSSIPSYDREYVHGIPIGTSDYNEKLPSWDIKVLKGEISSSNVILTGTLGNIQIPQIDIKDIYITTKVKKLNEVPFEDVESLEDDLSECGEDLEDEIIFTDNTVIDAEIDSLMVNIKENNIPLTKDNFIIEIFEEKDGQLLPLKFIKESQNIVNNILLDDDEISTVILDDFEPSDIDYYFDINFDQKINNSFKRQRPKNLYNFENEPIKEC